MCVFGGGGSQPAPPPAPTIPVRKPTEDPQVTQRRVDERKRKAQLASLSAGPLAAGDGTGALTKKV